MHSSIIHNCQNWKTTEMSINDRKYIFAHTMEYYIAMIYNYTQQYG